MVKIKINGLIEGDSKIPLRRLTTSNETILPYIANGLTDAYIARLLGISADAVNQHLTLVCQKLEASNRIEAVAKAISRHLIKS